MEKILNGSKNNETENANDWNAGVTTPKLILIWNSILILIGVPANLSIIIYLTKHYVGYSFDRVLLMGTAICNIFVLLNTPIRQIVFLIWHFGLLAMNLPVCVITKFVSTVSRDLSYLFLCILSVTRYIYFKYPVQTETNLCKMIKFVMISVAILHVIIKAIIGSIAYMKIFSKMTYCISKYKMIIYFGAYDFVIVIIPFVLNVMLLIQTKKLSTRQSISIHLYSKQSLNMAYLLVTLSIISIVFLLPSFLLFWIVTFFNINPASSSTVLMIIISNSFTYANYVVNCFAFIATSRKFQEFLFGEKFMAYFYSRPNDDPIHDSDEKKDNIKADNPGSMYVD